MPISSLLGLSPEEISSISTRRTASESGQRGDLGMLIDLIGAKRQMDLDRVEPDMVQIKIGEQVYEIPRKAQAEGAKAKAHVEELYRTGKIEQGKFDEWMKPQTVSLPDKEGNWTNYSVPSGMLQNMATAGKDLFETEAARAEENRFVEGLEDLGNTLPSEASKVSLKTFFKLGSGPAIAAMQGGKAAEMSSTELERARVNQEITTANIINSKIVNDASIAIHNRRNEELGISSAILHYKKAASKFDWTGEDKAVEVKLPPGKTLRMVEAAAKAKGWTTDHALKLMYEKQLKEK